MPFRPSRRGARPAEHRRACPARDVGGAVARLVVDDDHLVHARRTDDHVEERADPAGFVTGRDDDADRLHRRERRAHRGGNTGRSCEAGHRHRAGGQPRSDRDQSDTASHGAHLGPPGDGAGEDRRSAHRRSSVIISVTILALVVTRGRPPPGWLDPPTRYSPAAHRDSPAGRTQPACRSTTCRRSLLRVSDSDARCRSASSCGDVRSAAGHRRHARRGGRARGLHTCPRRSRGPVEC